MGALLAIPLLALGLIGAPAALAAEVSVHETPGDTNVTALIFSASPGEDNNLTIKTVGSSAEFLHLEVLDKGAAVAPGSGCSGGGAAGVAVQCDLHEPRWPASEGCGRSCSHEIPGTGWNGKMEIELGDGDNSFDGSSFIRTDGKAFAMTVVGGAGDDRIATGGGEDVIDPGAGHDEVRSGEGSAKIETTAIPDGPDRYEAGPNSVDELSYAQRTEPVYLRDSVAGAAGEGDQLVGGFYVIGGSGPDVLDGGPQDFRLEGGPGDDVLAGTRESVELFGGTGDDVLSANGKVVNHLVGEEGDDTYYGGEGVDLIQESVVHQTAGSRPESIASPSGGNDLAYGGGGDDVVDLGAGDDRLFGGTGNDALDGGADSDRVSGGAGADVLIGDLGFDRLLGGHGSDRLFSGRKISSPLRHEFPFPPAKDDGSDLVECGAGRDVAVANPWDRLDQCDVTHLVRPRETATASP